MISRGVSRTEPAFFISFFKSLALMLLPQQMMAVELTLHKRPIEDMQHLAANTKGPKLQEVQSALSLDGDGFIVASPLQSVVQVNSKVFILHDRHFFSHDGNSV
ncbi:hypothetical protein CHARACLAT_019686 [Characodon lateralis]|uniref:Uncharacterized protein n=1 Tax=Characodon lateralis TaxID=208331 RepID=A0ABU7EKL4_9TELE|nr:hypothetical protein [Characodon lateralis]